MSHRGRLTNTVLDNKQLTEWRQMCLYYNSLVIHGLTFNATFNILRIIIQGYFRYFIFKGLEKCTCKVQHFRGFLNTLRTLTFNIAIYWLATYRCQKNSYVLKTRCPLCGISVLMNIPRWCCRTCQRLQWSHSQADTQTWSSAGSCRRQIQSAGSRSVCSGQSGSCPDCRRPWCGCPSNGWQQYSLECAEIHTSTMSLHDS